MRGLSLLGVLVFGCAAPPAMPVEDAASDAADEPFELCARPCAAGEVCRGFRCVTVTRDAGARDVSDAARSDAEPTPTMACCPIDPTPHCGCVRAGGARRADGTCRTICGEGYPELWFRRVGADGCPSWSTAGLRCPSPDAAVDVAENDR
jgi:hypothetical protein